MKIAPPPDWMSGPEQDAWTLGAIKTLEQQPLEITVNVEHSGVHDELTTSFDLKVQEDGTVVATERK